KVPPGRRFVLPGTHDVSAETPDGARASEHVNAVAGATYRLALRAETPTHSPPSTASPSSEAQPKSAVPADSPASAATDSGSASHASSSKTLPPAVFYAGLGATVFFVAVTAWSGLDTLAEKAKYDDAPAEYSQEKVWSKAHRTDYLVGATLVLGAAT